MLLSSKQRTTCRIASVSRMFAKNLFPSPSPLEAPATSPAISTKSIAAWIIFPLLLILHSSSNRKSTTSTLPTLGSMVQNGKLDEGASFAVKALNREDLPTLGSPTIPQDKPDIYKFPLKLYRIYFKIRFFTSSACR